jgi:2-isopropylmalate synthase
MTKQRVYLFDTTLRDGAQTSGLDFTLEDKILIARMLDDIGLDYVEGGYPGANPTDTEFFTQKRMQSAAFTAFGMTKRAGVSVANDPGIAALLGSKADVICYVAKAWDYHVRVALGTTLEENLIGIRQSVEVAKAAGREVIVDCEHFFDGYLANPDYALACATAAHEAGARWVVLCDSNGGTLPGTVGRIVGEVARHVPGDSLGIHAHNDTEHAVANSLAAVLAGARQIQGTLNGVGERCGNANLISIIPTLKLKADFADRFEIGVADAKLRELTRIAHRFDELINRMPNRHAPYVGAAAFATKTGIHASALAKDPRTYEHVPPEAVGNQRHVLVSNQSGKANLRTELTRLGIEVAKDNPKLDTLLRLVKERESEGFAYETADGSFELLARRTLEMLPKFFHTVSFRVVIEKQFERSGEGVAVSEAIVHVRVGKQMRRASATGDGPLDALDRALRLALVEYRLYIDDMTLIDFKVRILNTGTGATTRVFIESEDREGNTWSTIGVSETIVDAIHQALEDSIVFRLLKAGAPVAEAKQPERQAGASGRVAPSD